MLRIRPIDATAAAAVERAGARAPYLARLAARHAGCDVETAFATLTAAPDSESREQFMARLRKAKQQLHLALAGDDLAGRRPVMETTALLSRFADLAASAALAAALAEAGLTGQGLFFVALGKLGAGELNYSSDIDIAAFYDPAEFDGGARSPGEAASRAVQAAVRRLEEITAEGYVFRTDLRLRPDPGSTPVAVSTEMAQHYYETRGQNWERMVWIKARHCAGDDAAAARFVAAMQPYVWRRHLDYWAISDIQAIKRMINARIGDDRFATVAPDVKLSPGGIREIEFFAQTQQLILGGRDNSLRVRDTLGALSALCASGAVSRDVTELLSNAYLALRSVEHRIQMLNDEQTHTVPEDEASRGAVAELCGYDRLASFDADLLETRREVHRAYEALFATEDRAAAVHPYGNLVFTGVDDDPETVRTLQTIGFKDPSTAIDAVRTWHRGSVPATRSVRGRELLTALLPGLIGAMGRTGEPDLAFTWFARFFEGLTSGVQILSMLLAEPVLRDDLVATLALAPRLARILARRPDLLEALVSRVAPSPPEISPTASFDAMLDVWRQYHREAAFLIGHRLLHGLVDAEASAASWTQLADESIRAMAAAAEYETVRKLGPRPGRWIVAGMGKLGGSEMTASSDLDLIVIYDALGDDSAAAWYSRFTQRLITALTAATAEGGLYEVDMRLRPSGRAGPVAVSLDAFRHYQTTEAWTWEHMALTRLRPVAGDSNLGEEVEGIAREAICSRARTGRRGSISADIRDMRATLYREKPGSGLWDMKSAPGGLVDIEFIVQREMLLRADPRLIQPNTALALSALAGREEEDSPDWSFLRAALHLLASIQQIQRVALSEEGREDADPPAGLKARLCRMTGESEFDTLSERLAGVKARVHAMARDKIQFAAPEFPPRHVPRALKASKTE